MYPTVKLRPVTRGGLQCLRSAVAALTLTLASTSAVSAQDAPADRGHAPRIIVFHEDTSTVEFVWALPDSSYIIEFSSDLQNWQPYLGEVDTKDGQLTLSVSTEGRDRRFFRLRLLGGNNQSEVEELLAALWGAEGDDEESREKLERILDEAFDLLDADTFADREQGSAVLRAAAMGGSSYAVKLLFQGLDSEDLEVRRRSQEILDDLLDDFEAALPGFLCDFESDTVDVREDGRKALAAIYQRLFDLLGHRDWRTRERATALLKTAATCGIIEALKLVLQGLKSEDLEVRRRCELILECVLKELDKAMEGILRDLKSGKPTVRKAASDVLDDLLDHIFPLLGDDDWRTRVRATNALEKAICAGSKKALDLVIEGTKSEDLEVQWRCNEILRRVLKKALAKLGSANAEERQAARDLFLRLIEEGIGVVFRILDEGLKADDEAVRRACAELWQEALNYHYGRASNEDPLFPPLADWTADLEATMMNAVSLSEPDLLLLNVDPVATADFLINYHQYSILPTVIIKTHVVRRVVRDGTGKIIAIIFETRDQTGRVLSRTTIETIPGGTRKSVDRDADGNADTIYVDRGANGSAVIHDDNDDGKPDRGDFDTDGDGFYDTSWIDLNGDGKMEKDELGPYLPPRPRWKPDLNKVSYVNPFLENWDWLTEEVSVEKPDDEVIAELLETLWDEDNNEAENDREDLEELLDLAFSWLGDESYALRLKGTNILRAAAQGGSSYAIKLLLEGLASEDLEVRERCREILDEVTLNPEMALPGLFCDFESDLVDVREDGRKALAAVFEKLFELLGHRDWRTRERATEMLEKAAACGNVDVLKLVLEGLKSDDLEVRARCERILKHALANFEKMMAGILRDLKSANEAVRTKAQQMLDKLVEFVFPLLSDPDWRTRERATNFLIKAICAGNKKALDLVIEGTRSKDLEVKYRCIAILRRILTKALADLGSKDEKKCEEAMDLFRRMIEEKIAIALKILEEGQRSENEDIRRKVGWLWQEILELYQGRASAEDPSVPPLEIWVDQIHTAVDDVLVRADQELQLLGLDPADTRETLINFHQFGILPVVVIETHIVRLVVRDAEFNITAIIFETRDQTGKVLSRTTIEPIEGGTKTTTDEDADGNADQVTINFGAKGSATYYDHDDDGTADSGSFDTDGDGFYDLSWNDLDGDGVVDANELSQFGIEPPRWDPDLRKVDFGDPLPGLWPTDGFVATLPDDLQGPLDAFDHNRSGDLDHNEVSIAIGFDGLPIVASLVELQQQGLAEGAIELEHAIMSLPNPFLQDVLTNGVQNMDQAQLWGMLDPEAQQAMIQASADPALAPATLFYVLALRLVEFACGGDDEIAPIARQNVQGLLQFHAGIHPIVDAMALQGLLKTATPETQAADGQVFMNLLQRVQNNPEQFYQGFAQNEEEHAFLIEGLLQRLMELLGGVPGEPRL